MAGDRMIKKTPTDKKGKEEMPTEELKEQDVRTELENFQRTAQIIFKKLERQIEILEAIEASVEEKLITFERLLQMADTTNLPSGGSDNRRREVLALKERGLQVIEIAEILGMRTGEVELILNLNQ
ncbi:hypothetical protein MCHI_000493 [Candidatus Magnetoovum chiemensis]|nr:hypothetical protein MCHI_000493 [Candidatus Magnetoovum chiemensis]